MRRVTLTFDNGPEPDVTPSVLDTLRRHDILSTFFVLGNKVSDPARRAVAQGAAAEGHRIGNHTFSHRTPLGNLSEAEALAEFDRTEETLNWLDQSERYFRPYGGGGAIGQHLLHPAVVERMQQRGTTCVIWNVVPRDWSKPEGWVQRALGLIEQQPWSLVVLHDVPSGAMTQLDEFIERLKDEGTEFTQAFPPECVPIVRGKIVLPIDAYVQNVMRK